LNLLDATALYVKEIGSKSVCLLATDGTIKSRLFHDALEKIGIEVVTPSDSVQADLMEIIYDIKRGEAVSPEALYSIAAKACGDDIDAVILGCTELCVLTDGTKKTDEPSPCLPSTPVLINILDVLAEASIAFCRGGNERN
jgi:aspartate racemase